MSTEQLNLNPFISGVKIHILTKAAFLIVQVFVSFCLVEKLSAISTRQGKFIYIAHFIHSGNSKCFT